jgi:hypothetical protein
VRPEAHADSPQSHRIAAAVAAGAIAIGVVLRAWVWLNRGSLFLDEASLALNVLARGYAALAQPLDWGQAAPLGFLWVERALTAVAGPGEWVLRAWPLVAGAATVPLTWIVARRVGGPWTGAIAAAAVAPSLIALRYASEAKPYASDAFAAIALALLAMRARERPESAGRWLVLGVAGVACVLLSLPSVFVLAAVVASVMRRGAPWRERAWLLGCGTAWVATFAALWFGGLGQAAGGAYLAEYWAPVMLSPSGPALAPRLVRALGSVAATPFRWQASVAVTVVAIGAWAAGLTLVARRNLRAAALLGGPVVFAALASALGRYPLSDRLAFFACPLAVVATAAALDAVRPRVGRGAAGAGVVIAGGLFAWVGAEGLAIVRAPGSLEPTRTLFTSVFAEARAGGVPVYVFARAVPAWVYATTDWRAVDAVRLERWTLFAGDISSPGHENFSRPGAVAMREGEGFVVRRGFTTPDSAGRAMPTGFAELAGLATGVRYRIAGPMSRDEPSPGWAAEEARRIASVAHPATWVVASHFFEGSARDELRPLVDALGAAGLRVVEERRGGRDAVALRVERIVSPATPPAAR